MSPGDPQPWAAGVGGRLGPEGPPNSSRSITPALGTKPAACEGLASYCPQEQIQTGHLRWLESGLGIGDRRGYQTSCRKGSTAGPRLLLGDLLARLALAGIRELGFGEDSHHPLNDKAGSLPRTVCTNNMVHAQCPLSSGSLGL